MEQAWNARTAIEGAKAYLKAKGKNIPIECEVRSLEDIDEVFAAGGVDRIIIAREGDFSFRREGLMGR